ncbi:phage tail assembly chaperone [Pseudomonas sp. KCJK8993]|uniref:phage tail assembly chaperone n=1 Tax=Pseudomonas sp. KCJK8993 TaxID=3344565 RepID=UPI0039066844
MYYCRINDTRGGFFDSKDHGEFGSPGCTIPKGAKKITNAQHAELLAAQDNGKLIVPDADGYPIAIEPTKLSDEELAVIERAWRDAQLAATDAIIMRHRDELEDGAATTLTADQYSQLQAYRRALRAWPESGEFPLSQHRPPAPEWLSGLLA